MLRGTTSPVFRLRQARGAPGRLLPMLTCAFIHQSANTCQILTLKCVNCRSRILWSTEDRSNSRPQNHTELLITRKSRQCWYNLISCPFLFLSPLSASLLLALTFSRPLACSTCLSCRIRALALKSSALDEPTDTQLFLPYVTRYFISSDLIKGCYRGLWFLQL